jgi:hypothetical protein
MRIARWFAGEIGTPFIAAVVLGGAGLWLWFNVMSTYVVGIVASDLAIVVAILVAISAWAVASAITSGVRAGCGAPADVLRQE